MSGGMLEDVMETGWQTEKLGDVLGLPDEEFSPTTYLEKGGIASVNRSAP